MRFTRFLLPCLSFLTLVTSLTAAVPRINSISPLSARVGDLVTLSGSNFSSVSEQNIVRFGTTKGEVVEATATSLVVRVPAAAVHGPVTVTTSGLTASSLKMFMPTFLQDGAFGNQSLAPRVVFPAGANTVGTGLGDFNDDGRSDVIAANYGGSTVSIYKNISNPGPITTNSLSPKADWTVGLNPCYFSVGDVDGDGVLDLVVANHSAQSISVYRNISSGGDILFAPRVDFPAGMTPYNVAIGDLDGDGRPDLAAANAHSSTVSVFRNLSSPGIINSSSFAAKVDFPVGTMPERVIICDIDGDEKPDLVTGNDAAASVSVCRNIIGSPGSITTGSFEAPVNFPVGARPQGVVAGDFDGDGRLDLAVPNYSGASISVLRNNSAPGVISFAARFDLPTGGSTHDVAAVDIDGNGRLDLVAVCEFSNTACVFRNMGTNGPIAPGSFAARLDFPAGHNPAGVSAGDIDNDGRPDILLGNYNGTVSILRNVTPVAGRPVITLQPTNQMVSVGDVVTFSVAASGAGPFSYRWRKTGVPLVDGDRISGAKTSTLTISNVLAPDAAGYSVEVTNPLETTLSSTATLTVVSAPMILIQPVSQPVPLGSNATFTVTALGSAPLRFQWSKNGSPLAGATTPTLLLKNVQPSAEGAYSVVISNSFGFVTSDSAVLSVILPPTIVQNPASQAVFAHSSVTMSVVATGDEPLSYHWRFNGNPIPGATRSTIEFNDVLLSDAGDYDVFVSNAAGDALSAPATLSVQLRDSDFNNDTHPDIIWQQNSGTIALWFLNGTSVADSVVLRAPVVPSGWRIVGQADIDQDSSSDLFLQHNTTGAIAVWFMNQTNRIGAASLRSPSSGWRVAGLHDFNHDMSVDILWQHNDGRLAVWFQNGTNFLSATLVRNGQAAGSGWSVAALLDLNRDGQKDILWQHTTGKLAAWYMNGTTFLSTTTIVTGPVTGGSRVVGAADFNSDTHTDLLWQHNDNTVSIWLMNGAVRASSISLNRAGLSKSSWRIVGPK